MGNQLKIKEHTYTVRLLSSGLGLQVAARLMNLLGPGIKGMNEEEDNGGKMVAFVGELLSDPKLDQQLKFFTDTFQTVSSVQIAGKEVELSSIYETHFMGKYFELIRWLVFCFEVNHGSFLAELGFNVAQLEAKLRAVVSESQKLSETNG